MKLIQTIDFSNILKECCDDDYQKFNGSIYNYGNYTVIAWRAQKKPEKLSCKEYGEGKSNVLPTYPYLTMSGSWNYDEYAGVYIIDNKSGEKNFLKYKHMNAYAAEDPRLYSKYGKLYMYYTAQIQSLSKKHAGLWEVVIDVKNKKFSTPKQICSDVFKKNKEISIYDHINWVIYKNFSFVKEKNAYLDGFNKNIEIYKELLSVDKCITKKLKSSMPNNLLSFVQDDWKIALTTPTILHKDKLIGIAHIRVSWENLSRNFKKLNKNVQGMLYKNDVHLSDVYFMMIYFLDCKGDCQLEGATWYLSKPFMLTGNTMSNKYYSYDINFPCGLNITKEGNLKISYGLGDCLFFESEISYNEKDLKTGVQYDYKDLELYHLELPVIEKKPIIEKLNCPSTIKFILPKTVFLFDLGGSGLKLCIYTFKRSYSKMFKLGYWNKESLPDLNKMVNNAVSKMDFDQYIHKGAYVMFSLAGTNKIWDPKLRKKLSVKPLYEDKKYHNMYNLFDIPKHIRLSGITDNSSHFWGNVSTLNDIYNTNILNKSVILSIPIGTGINMKLKSRGKLISPSKYLWDYKYNGRSIRTGFKNVSNMNDLYSILGYIIRESYGDFDMNKIDYIIFSGGVTNVLFKSISKKYLDDTEDVQNLSGTNIYLNKDELCPYKGLMYKLSMDNELMD